jgi:GH24 family phage-related lysozyme (muramidase)
MAKPIRNPKNMVSRGSTATSKGGFLRTRDLATEAAVSSSKTLKMILNVNSQMSKNILSGFGGKGIFGGLFDMLTGDKFLSMISAAIAGGFAKAKFEELINAIKGFSDASKARDKYIDDMISSTLKKGVKGRTSRGWEEEDAIRAAEVQKKIMLLNKALYRDHDGPFGKSMAAKSIFMRPTTPGGMYPSKPLSPDTFKEATAMGLFENFDTKRFGKTLSLEEKQTIIKEEIQDLNEKLKLWHKYKGKVPTDLRSSNMQREMPFKGIDFGDPLHEYTKFSIKRSEDLRLESYPDVGGRSIGYGHLIKEGEEYLLKGKITREKAVQLFERDYQDAVKSAKRLPGFDNLDDFAKSVVIDMMYNMGEERFSIKKWPTFMGAASTQDYDTMINSIRKSKYAKQVKSRATRNISLLQRAMSSGQITQFVANDAAISGKPVPTYKKETPVVELGDNTLDKMTDTLADKIKKVVGSFNVQNKVYINKDKRK